MFLSKQPEIKTVAPPVKNTKETRIDCLLSNKITYDELIALRRTINAVDLSNIIQRIYDLNEKYILQISAVEGLLRRMNNFKNSRRNAKFLAMINDGFRDEKYPDRKVILAEGDSWFNYPVILTDIIDRISLEKNFALYSLASGGDWLLNMLTARHYVEELTVLRPDVFLISGGGNDLAGGYRMATFIEPDASKAAYLENKLVEHLLSNRQKKAVPLDRAKFDNGAKHLSKDFLSLLQFFHLQYYYLINGILSAETEEPGKIPPESKFKGIRIITQGYDYGIPSFEKSFGRNPLLWYVPFIRSLLGHGRWLKTPMLMRGIKDPQIQEDIIYAMIYLFNEMAIDIGIHFNKLVPGSVFHIDSRGTVPREGWADELHVRPEYFRRIAEVFIKCINQSEAPTYGHVYVVNPPKHEKN